MTPGNTNDIETATRAEMFNQLVRYQQVYALGVVEAARWQINSERNARLEDMLLITSNNPFVPEGRELIYAEGLHAGLKGNFLVTAHLLIPQLEHSLREILYDMGIVPSSLDANGIQSEWGLNRTLYQDETRQLLGEDLTFCLQGLLVSPFGANLRNQMAHGLWTRNAFYSYATIYLWWIVIRILFVNLLSQSVPPVSDVQDQYGTGAGISAHADPDTSGEPSNSEANQKSS